MTRLSLRKRIKVCIVYKSLANFYVSKFYRCVEEDALASGVSNLQELFTKLGLEKRAPKPKVSTYQLLKPTLFTCTPYSVYSCFLLFQVLNDTSLDGIIEHIKKNNCKNIITMAGAGISTGKRYIFVI